MPLYGQHCDECDIDFDHLRPMSEASTKPPCPKCKKPARRVYQVQIGAIDGDLIGAYGYGPTDNPYHEIKEGPDKGKTVVPGKRRLFDDTKRLNDSQGEKVIEWH